MTLRASGLWKIVPGEIAVVKPRKQWRYAGHPCPLPHFDDDAPKSYREDIGSGPDRK